MPHEVAARQIATNEEEPLEHRGSGAPTTPRIRRRSAESTPSRVPQASRGREIRDRGVKSDAPAQSKCGGGRGPPNDPFMAPKRQRRTGALHRCNGTRSRGDWGGLKRRKGAGLS